MLTKTPLRYFALLLSSFVLGAIPMLAARRAYGRLRYWAGFTFAAGFLAMFVSSPLGILTMTLTVLVGVYCEVEDHGSSVFTAGFVSVLAAIGTAAFAAGLYVNRTHGRLIEGTRELVGPLVAKAAERVGATVDAESVLLQFPSIAMVALMISLAIALLVNKAFMGEAALPRQERTTKPVLGGLSSFRVPDVFIWITIASIFGAFYQHGNVVVEAISVNVFNVMLIAFFFQGLAVIAQAFRTFQVSPMWQGFWFLFIVFQLLALVSLLGFADFWMDFRERLARGPAASKKSF